MFKAQIGPASSQKNEDFEFLSNDRVVQSQNQPSKGQTSLLYPSSQMMPDQQELKMINPGKFVGPIEKPRTANKAFGGISDFILFFENRNPEMKEFVNEFKRIEKLNSECSIEALNKAIAPKVNHCLTEMYKKSGTILPNKYADLFTRTFNTWEQFYNQIFLAYTIAGFLYEKMNEFLRNEDWEKLDDLLPYAYSLFKAFLWGPTGLTFSKNFEFLRSISKENKLIVFRGADFDDGSLKFYNTSKTKYFSWNGVTSTSLNKDIARKFQNNSTTKTPVLITIEVDFENLNPQDLTAFYLEGVSKHPEEKEVALPPGSIFELLHKSEEGSEVEIKLKLVTNAKVLAHEGQFMHGMLQAVMGQQDELKIVCLKDKELSRAIRHCRGNRLITKLEFFLCNFNEHSARLLQEVLPTMKNLNSLTFNSVVFERKCGFGRIFKSLRTLKITKLEITNSISENRQVKSLIGKIKYFGFLESFKLSFQEEDWINQNLVRKLYNQVYQYLKPKCVFELNVINVFDTIAKGLNANKCHGHLGKRLQLKGHINPKGKNVLKLVGTKRPLGLSFIEKNFERNLKTNLEKVKPLDTLNLRFKGWKNMNDQDLKNLGGKDLQSLIHLNLDFSDCHALTDKALKILSKDVIWQLPMLESLNLCFDNCEKITDEGLASLIGDSIQYLQFLTTLKLSFSGCEAITNQGLKHFSKLGKEIKCLSLSFERCLKVTNQGLENLLDLKSIQSLTNLNLNLSHCPEITNKALKILSEKALQNLKKSLNELSLKFDCCNQITDKGLKFLVCEGISHLGLLQNLCLSFESPWRDLWNSFIYQLTDDGLSAFRKCLNSNSSLKTLHLNFAHYEIITGQTLRDLCFPQKLITLHLSFNECMQIDNTIFQSLSLSHLNSLESLHLSFRDCETISEKQLRINKSTTGITDEGLKMLASDGIRHLPELKTLCLDFNGHGKITHKGLKDLCSHLNKNKLTGLNLSFSEVTDQGLEALNFQEISLNSLSLCFHNSPQLSDEGLKSFWREGIQQQTKLKNLSLRFDQCKKITDEGLKGICQQGIRHLTSLVSLDLNFSHCDDITKGQILSLQYQINLLNLQLPLEIILEKNDLRISSQSDRDATSQDTLKFRPNKTLSQQKAIRKLTLKFKDKSEITDFDISQNITKLKSFKCLKTLNLRFDECVKITDFTLHTVFSHGLQHLESLSSLSLNFAGCNQITDTGLKVLGGIKHLKSLVRLSLNFNGCERITNKGIKKLCYSGIKPLESLKFLCLSFKLCDKITNKSIKRLYHKGIKSFTSFYMDFSEVKMTERLKRQLSRSSSTFSGIIGKNKLKSTSSSSQFQRHNVGKQINLEVSEIDSSRGEIVKNTMFTRYIGRNHYELHIHDDQLEEPKHLFRFPKKDVIGLKLLFKHTKLLNNQELSYLTSLTSLHLTLDKWKNQVTDKTLNALCLDVFPHINSLASLYLNFHGCDKITDAAGLKCLGSQGIKHLRSSLTTLHLDFGECSKITDVGLQSLWTDGILCLEVLTTLDLSFEKCRSITGECFNVGRIKDLTSLALNFENCFGFKDENFKSLCMEVIQNLAKLHILHLNFNKCFQITDSGIEYLSLQKKSFSTLSLSFDECWRMTGKGFQSLSLNDTTVLHLNLSRCSKIALNLKLFNSLKILHLNFQGSFDAITDQSLGDLCETGLRHLVSLDVLGLCFDSCKKITDEGVRTLCCNGLRFMKELTTLYLSISQCGRITEKSLEILCHDGIKHLGQLTNLCLRFLHCTGISYTALLSLQNQISLLPLPYLQPLAEISDDSRQILSQSDPALSRIFPSKCDQLMLQKVRNQKIMNAMINKSKYNNCYYSGDMENFKRSEITGKINGHELENLSSEGVQDLVRLTKLSINFTGEAMIKRELADLAYKGLGSLQQLKALYINFSHRQNFTDEGLMDLSHCGIKNLEQLNTLHINLNGCCQITDRGLASLCSGGIKNLKELKTLNLTFDGCDKLTDEALKSVSLKGILNLSSIENLGLSFRNCPRISLASYQEFLKILSYLGYVRGDQNLKDSGSPKDSEYTEDPKDSKDAEELEDFQHPTNSSLYREYVDSLDFLEDREDDEVNDQEKFFQDFSF